MCIWINLILLFVVAILTFQFSHSHNCFYVKNTAVMLIYTESKSNKETNVTSYPAGICLLKVSDRSSKTWCEICSKLTIKTPERRHCLYC